MGGSPSPAEVWDADYYSDGHVMAHYGVRYSGFRTMVSILKSKAGVRGRWLDVGCGIGTFLEVAHEAGWDVSGIEPSRYCVEAARNRMPYADIRATSTEEGLEEFRDLAVVSFSNVLRLLDRPGAILRSVHRALSPGGWILVRECNADRRREARAMEKSSDSLSFHTYLQEWNPGSLESAMKTCGFSESFSLPAPAFFETAEDERSSETTLRFGLKRFVKSVGWPVARTAHALSGSRIYLGLNFLTLGRK